MAGDRRLRVGDSSATSLPTIATQSNSVCRGLLGPQPLFGSPHGDPSVTGTRMASDVGQSLPHDAQNPSSCFPKRSLKAPVSQVQAYVALRGYRAMALHEGLEQLREGPVLLYSQAQVVDGAAQLLPRTLERRGQPSQPVDRVNSFKVDWTYCASTTA